MTDVTTLRQIAGDDQFRQQRKDGRKLALATPQAVLAARSR